MRRRIPAFASVFADARRTTHVTCFSIVVLILMTLATGCGDGGHSRVAIGQGTVPEPGNFDGLTSAGGTISIRVGSIDQILFACSNTPILNVFSPPQRIRDDGTFDVTFQSTGRSFRVTGTFVDGDTAQGSIEDAQHQCDVSFEVTRSPS